MLDIAAVRQTYAQQIVAVAGATAPALLDAFAAIPRERFLGPGPWVIVGAGDPKPRRTPDADPRHVYADASVAIDAERQLFNGAPSFLARMIESLALAPGSRVVHIGAGTPGGRLLLPLTVAMPAMGGTLGKGVMLMIRKSEAGTFAAHVTSFVAIYSALGLRESGIERILSEALRRTSFPNLTQLRRDTHDRVDNCWLHTERFCLSMEPIQ